MTTGQTLHADALSISGNPTDDEIAAIAAAYRFLLSRGGQGAPDHAVRSLTWNMTTSQGSVRTALPGKSRTWVNAHRLLAR